MSARKLNAELVSREQLGEVVHALGEALASKNDLRSFADILDRQLPALFRKEAAATQTNPSKSAWRFTIVRDDSGLAAEIYADPIPADEVPQ